MRGLFANMLVDSRGQGCEHSQQRKRNLGMDWVGNRNTVLDQARHIGRHGF